MAGAGRQAHEDLHVRKRQPPAPWRRTHWQNAAPCNGGAGTAWSGGRQLAGGPRPKQPSSSTLLMIARSKHARTAPRQHNSIPESRRRAVSRAAASTCRKLRGACGHTFQLLRVCPFAGRSRALQPKFKNCYAVLQGKGFKLYDAFNL